MENTTREGQYVQAQISCTADEQLRRDEEFNWLMQCGTVVRMERFEVEEFRTVLEQLVAEGSCFRTAPVSSTMGRVMRQLTQGASGYEANLTELRAAAQNALLFVFPLEKDLEMCLRFERVRGTGLALTRLGVSPVNGDLWVKHWAMRSLECTGAVFAVESAPGACNFELRRKTFYAMLSMVELSTLGLAAEPKDFSMFDDPKAMCTKFKRERRDCRRAMRAQYDRAA